MLREASIAGIASTAGLTEDEDAVDSLSSRSSTWRSFQHIGTCRLFGTSQQQFCERASFSQQIGLRDAGECRPTTGSGIVPTVIHSLPHWQRGATGWTRCRKGTAPGGRYDPASGKPADWIRIVSVSTERRCRLLLGHGTTRSASPCGRCVSEFYPVSAEGSSRRRERPFARRDLGGHY
jgi:hypothetical protein